MAGDPGFKVSMLHSFRVRMGHAETMMLKPWEACPSSKEGPQARLLADAELADHGLVALGIVFLEVVEQATALADQHEKSAARAVVFLVRLEVLRQLANAFAKQSDLHFRASGIACVGPVLVNEGFLLLSG